MRANIDLSTSQSILSKLGARLSKQILLHGVLIQERSVILAHMQRDGRVALIYRREIFEHEGDMVEIIHIGGPPEPCRKKMIADDR